MYPRKKVARSRPSCTPSSASSILCLGLQSGASRRANPMADADNRERSMDDMGTFRTTIVIESAEHRGEMRTVENALVDTGSEYTWVPSGVLAELGIRQELQHRFIVAVGPP